MKRIQTPRRTVIKGIRNLAIGMMGLALTMSAALAAEPKSDEEFVGPFPSWSNVKSDFGAAGNGVADDTAALQKALDTFQQKSSVLYLPAGTYRITKGLLMTSHMSVAVTGEDPARTIIKWDGGNEGMMLLCNGVRYSKIGRITWDGGGKPVTAVFHRWDGHTPNAATGLEHADEVYKDVAVGLRAGLPHFMDAECMVSRCKFLRCSNTGLLINSMNALDWWLWNCEFVACHLGATNQADGEYGGGHFHIYESLFRNSTEADIRIGHCSYFGIRNNTSIGSKAFFLAVRPAVGAGAWKPDDTWSSQVILQGNTILDPQDATPIRFASSSSALLIDNVIRGRAGATGPVVKMNAPALPAIVAIGNTVTVPNPYLTTGKVTDIDTTIVTPAGINPPLPELSGNPPQTQRRVFEVPAKAGSAAVQRLIDEAAKMAGQRPVVHLASGVYSLDRTLVIPAGADIQLIGDGQSSVLNGTGQGSGPALPFLVRATPLSATSTWQPFPTCWPFAWKAWTSPADASSPNSSGRMEASMVCSCAAWSRPASSCAAPNRPEVMPSTPRSLRTVVPLLGSAAPPVATIAPTTSAMAATCWSATLGSREAPRNSFA